jgi:hypothetical protein
LGFRDILPVAGIGMMTVHHLQSKQTREVPKRDTRIEIVVDNVERRKREEEGRGGVSYSWEPAVAGSCRLERAFRNRKYQVPNIELLWLAILFVRSLCSIINLSID